MGAEEIRKRRKKGSCSGNRNRCENRGCFSLSTSKSEKGVGDNKQHQPILLLLFYYMLMLSYLCIIFFLSETLYGKFTQVLYNIIAGRECFPSPFFLILTSSLALGLSFLKFNSSSLCHFLFLVSSALSLCL